MNSEVQLQWKTKLFEKEYKHISLEVGPSGSQILKDFPWFYKPKVHEIVQNRPAMQEPPGSIGERPQPSKNLVLKKGLAS